MKKLILYIAVILSTITACSGAIAQSDFPIIHFKDPTDIGIYKTLKDEFGHSEGINRIATLSSTLRGHEIVAFRKENRTDCGTHGCLTTFSAMNSNSGNEIISLGSIYLNFPIYEKSCGDKATIIAPGSAMPPRYSELLIEWGGIRKVGTYPDIEVAAKC